MIDETDPKLLEHVTTLVSRIILQDTGRTIVPGPSDRLLLNGDLDSVSVGHLVLAIQTELDVEFDLSDVNPENFGNIAAITRLIGKRRVA